MNKTKQLDVLFEKWIVVQNNEKKDSLLKTKLANSFVVQKSSFCKDGIICEKEFNKQNLKVLFIANEPNIETQEEIDRVKKGEKIEQITSQTKSFLDYYNDKNHNDDWRGKLRKRICEIILPAMLDFEITDFPVSDGWKNAKSLAFMNLNKRGGKGTIESHLKYYCKEYKDKILLEISIIDPDVIVWLGKNSFYMCSKVLFDSLEMKSYGALAIIENKKYPIILTHHTSSRIGNQRRANLIRNSYKEYLREKRK